MAKGGKKAKGARNPETGDARRERRLARQAEEQAARQQAARSRRIRTVAMSTVALALVATVLFFLFRPHREVAGVTRTPDRGGGHVENAKYDTATPTSGQHRASAPPCGPKPEALAPDLAVHALEHGTIVVWHKPGISAALRQRAIDILDDRDSHWILSPNPGIDRPFVATAWNRLLPFDRPGASLREFVDTYRQRGPETVDCPA